MCQIINSKPIKFDRMKKQDKESSEFDYSSFEKEAIKKLREGKGLTGEGGALTGLVKRILEVALDEELNAQLPELKASDPSNRKNGHTRKKVKTGLGEVFIEPPRDRQGKFDPKIIGKWDRSLAPEIEQQILALYGIGTSYADIRSHLKRMYGMDYSEAVLSGITDRISLELNAWKQRALSRVYAVIYLDAIHYRIREDRQVQTKAIYSVMGVDLEGQRDVLGLFIGQAEGARHWARVLENIKDRGVEDVLFFCVDGLNGFSEAIHGVFPQATVQRCIVHMVRTSLKYVNWKDYRELCKGLKTVYRADDAQMAWDKLQGFGKKWDEKYPEIREKWEDNWIELSPFFDYPEQLRRMIYTTNAVEALHRILRKATKTKGAFTNDRAIEKQLFLALKYSEKSWKRAVRGWPDIIRTLIREFPDRIGQDI